jgi:hypothetical protein
VRISQSDERAAISPSPPRQRAADHDRLPATPEPPATVETRYRLHGGLTLAAIMGLAVGTRTLWTSYAVTRPGFAVTIAACYVVMLVAAVVALCARSGRALARVDLLVLITAVALKALAVWPSITGERAIGVDEGMLMDEATRALAAGHNPYLMSWPDIDPSLPTRLMDGGAAFDFGYPPFAIEVGAALQRLFPAYVGITVLAALALLATAIIVFRVAPAPLRPLATLGILGLGTLTSYTQNAYPSLIALPLLCLAVWKWTSIGRDGRLGWGGAVRAAALGLALATHQLGWFLALFLVVGLVLLRRGELSTRATAAVLLRYAAVVAAPFFLASLPFLITTPGAWLTGITEPLTQHAVPHGQGIMDVSYYLIGGSGALDFYGHASLLLLLAMLIAYAAHLPRLGRAAVVLPWLIFAVSTRSQDGYFLLTMPLWIVGLCTTTVDDFAGAYRFRLPAIGVLRSRGRAIGLAATVALFVPAVTCVAIAMATPQPLHLRVTGDVAAGRTIRSLTVEVTNGSSRAVTPHFAVTNGVDITQFWTVQSGPATIAPHSAASFTLAAPQGSWTLNDTSYLRAVSDGPQTLSSVRL